MVLPVPSLFFLHFLLAMAQHLMIDEGYTYWKSTDNTLNLFVLINSSFNNAGSSSEYKYHTVGRYTMRALESM